MKKINVSSKLSFIISIITSIIFVLYFAYKGFVVYFVQKAMDDTFVGGNTSDITITLWFGISVAMALSMFLFFQFTKIKDLNSQRTIQKGIFIGWTIIAITMIIFIPSYIYFILITIVSSIVSLLSSITLKHKITEDQKNKKETLSFTWKNQNNFKKSLCRTKYIRQYSLCGRTAHIPGRSMQAKKRKSSIQKSTG